MRNKGRKEEKECREDMSQRGGEDRQNVRKRGRGVRGERRGEFHVFAKVLWFFSFTSLHLPRAPSCCLEWTNQR